MIVVVIVALAASVVADAFAVDTIVAVNTVVVYIATNGIFCCICQVKQQLISFF